MTYNELVLIVYPLRIALLDKRVGIALTLWYNASTIRVLWYLLVSMGLLAIGADLLGLAAHN